MHSGTPIYWCPPKPLEQVILPVILELAESISTQPKGGCSLEAAKEIRATDHALTEAQARHPCWGIWISSAGRYWATRRGNIRLVKHLRPGWAMTIDADSLAELEIQIKEQEECGHAPAPVLHDFEDL